MIEAIKVVLKGIDQTELESPDGWWETSAGAEFGAKKLKYILGLLAQPAQQEPWCMKMNGCKTKCEDCPVEVAQQEPVAKYSDIVSDGGLDPRNKFDAPPQPEERNFCQRCGKRTADLTVIHTCTPPQQDQETVFFGVKDQGVKVSSLEFVTRVMGKEEVIGKPIFWAEWPSKEPK